MWLNYNYKRVEKGEPFYDFIQQAKNDGRWMCDSADHNESNGCSNPDCFKHPRHSKNRTWSAPSVLGDL